MLKPVTGLLGGLLGLAVALGASATAFAQSESPPAAQAETQLVGFPVYSSDGQQLGQVVQVAMLDGKLQGVRAELGQFLGVGAATALISADIVDRKEDRLEVMMTADDVRKALTKSNSNQNDSPR
jgi:hypothetical protein